MSSYFQSEATKSIRDNRSVSTYKHAPHSRFSSTNGLDVQSRFIAGLFPSSSGPVQQTISASNLQRRVTGNDLPSIRAKHSAEDLRMSYKLDRTSTAQKRSQADRVPGRFSIGSSKPQCFSQTCQSSRKHAESARVSSKSRQVGDCASKIHHLSGNSLGSLDQPQVSTGRKIGHRDQKSHTSFRNRQNNTKRTSEFSRVTKLRQLCSSSRKIKPPSYPQVLELTARTHDLNKTQSSLSNDSGDALVATELLSSDPFAPTSASTFSSYRCVESCVGRSTRQSYNVWQLEPRRTTTTQQPERVVGHSQSFRTPCTEHATKFCTNSIRQSGCSGIPSQRRRDQISTTHESDLSNSSNFRRSTDSTQNLLHSGEAQQSSGLPIQASPTSGMASTAGLHGDDFLKDGNTSSGPVCFKNCSSSVQLCNTRSERSGGHVLRCFQRDMELSTGMDFSTSLSYPQSIDAPQPSQWCISSGGSSLGKSILEGGSQVSEHCSPIHINESEAVLDRHDNRPSTSQGSRYNLGSLEMWGWTEKIKSWDPTQLSLLRSSWRPSTWKTYKVAWNRWVSWALQHKINPTQPDGCELAQFLADLHIINKFAYNTILLHKSVVSTLCNVELSGKLSENVLVQHILKSISLKNPQSSKPPVWDINILTDYMKNYTVNFNNTFQMVRHTAGLLILCSGRRIHDLTLLSIDDQHCIIKDDSITFWPLFGSKTDCNNYRQSGWKLFCNPENQNLNPVFWINKTISVLKERRTKSDTSNLFTTLRGSPTAASRTVIAGWIKSLMKDAGIVATPGSVRSAVASKNWISNFPLDDILARGNWRSANTFQRFYRREVMTASPSDPLVTTLFNPIN